MKRSITYFLIAVAAMMFASCSQEMPDNLNQGELKHTRTVTVNMGPSELTKTTFSEEADGLVWVDGDQVAYFIDDGTRQIATIVDGSFTVDVDEGPHTVRIVYPLSENGAFDDATYEVYPKDIIPTVQVQNSISGAVTDFNGKNLPITGSTDIASGTGNVNVYATYDIAAASILAFTITGAANNAETIGSVGIYTTDGGKMLTDGQNYVRLSFPEGTEVQDLDGKTIYAVVEAADYGEIKVLMTTSTKTYVLNTDVTSKGDLPGFGNKQVYKYRWNLQSGTTTGITGLMVKLGDGEWSVWDGTTLGLQTLGLTAGGVFGGEGNPYYIKIATGGNTTFSSMESGGLNQALREIDGTSRIALDLSATRFETNTSPYLMGNIPSLQSFVFPIGENAELITNLYGMFSDCTNLTSVSAIPSHVTDVTDLFSGCSKFNQKVEFPESVTTMRCAFQNCSTFNQEVSIPANVTDLSYTFRNCSALNSSITIPTNSEIRTMQNTFLNCMAFDKAVHIPAKVENLSGTFDFCSAFNQDVSIPASVTDLSYTFVDCSTLNSTITIPTNSEILTMEEAFCRCEAFDKAVHIPSKVQNLSGTFIKCTAFNQEVTIPASVTDLSYTFQHCSSLNSTITIPTNSEILTMQTAFLGCEAFDKTLHIPSKVENLWSTFDHCSSFNQEVTIPASVTNMSSTFTDCSSLNSLITIPTNSEILTMESAFSGCEVFDKAIHIPSKVENLSGTFFNCSAFNQEVTIPASVTNLSLTFTFCSALSSPVSIYIPEGKNPGNISDDNTINISLMFLACSTENIDLKVTASKLGSESASNKWYGSLSNCSWTFKSVTGIEP